MISVQVRCTHLELFNGETDVFDIAAGVVQGDTLAPFLFIIVLDYALRKAIDGREEELGLQTNNK